MRLSISHDVNSSWQGSQSFSQAAEKAGPCLARLPPACWIETIYRTMQVAIALISIHPPFRSLSFRRCDIFVFLPSLPRSIARGASPFWLLCKGIADKAQH